MSVSFPTKTRLNAATSIVPTALTTSGFYLVPRRIKYLLALIIGGGGGSGGYGEYVFDSMTKWSGGNGGKGGVKTFFFKVKEGQRIPYAIGAGGAGGGSAFTFGDRLHGFGGVGGGMSWFLDSTKHFASGGGAGGGAGAAGGAWVPGDGHGHGFTNGGAGAGPEGGAGGQRAIDNIPNNGFPGGNALSTVSFTLSEYGSGGLGGYPITSSGQNGVIFLWELTKL